MERKNRREQRDITESVVSPTVASRQAESQIWKYQTKGGHGFAFEDANTLDDRLSGKHAKVIGGSNERRGPDRTVNGDLVQSKCYSTASATMNSAFDPHGGSYRYVGQQLEVPKDQYDKCVKLMEQRIREGRVRGHTDPADAKKLLRRSEYTRQQTLNIARAGTINSVIFDLKTGAVDYTGTVGLSFMINYAQGLWRGLDHTDAFKVAVQAEIADGLKRLVVHTASSQILRTDAAIWGKDATEQIVRTIHSTPIGKKCINSIARADLGKPVYGNTAIRHVSKLLISNAITATVMAIINCRKDFYRAVFDRSISVQQFFKNLAIMSAAIYGGSAGFNVGATAGAKVGAVLGSVVPGLGTIAGAAAGTIAGAFAGATAGGTVSGLAAKSIADEIVEDDAIKLMRSLKAELQTLSYEYTLSEQEVEKVLYLVRDEVDPVWFRGMYKETGGDPASCRDFVREQFEHHFMKITKLRLPINEKAVKAQLSMEDLKASYKQDNDLFLKALRDLNKLCGKILPWESREEFDEFMLDDSRTLKL